MPTLDHCPTCENPYSQGAAFCASCGQPRFAQASIDQSHNQAGMNIVASGNVTLADDNRWDTRPTTAMNRIRQHRIWPTDWISSISAIITIASFLGVSAGPLPALQIPLIIVGIAAAAVAYLSFIASADLRTHGYHVLPFDAGTLERDANGSIWLTEPTAQCPLCPDHRPGTMHVARSPEGPKWVCKNTPAHFVGFDGSQLPLL